MSFAAAENAFEAAREREHTDYPEATDWQIAEMEERERISETREPNACEAKILALLAEIKWATRDDLCDWFAGDPDFQYTVMAGTDEERLAFSPYNVDNSTSWLWRRRRIRSWRNTCGRDGIHAHSFGDLSYDKGTVCP